jgi:hypothetical protein
MKTQIKTLEDLKALGKKTKLMERVPFGFTLAKEKWGDSENVPLILATNKTTTSPASMGAFKEVKEIDFQNLSKEGNNIFILKKGNIRVLLRHYFHVVKNAQGYDPTKYSTIATLEDALTWSKKEVLVLTLYLKQKDMPS